MKPSDFLSHHYGLIGMLEKCKLTMWTEYGKFKISTIYAEMFEEYRIVINKFRSGSEHLRKSELISYVLLKVSLPIKGRVGHQGWWRQNTNEGGGKFLLIIMWISV